MESSRNVSRGLFLLMSLSFVLQAGVMNAQAPELWRLVASGEILTPLVVHDSGGISFAADDGNLYRVHEQGVRQWRRRLSETPSGEIAGLHDGSVVLGLESGAVKRVGPAGAVAWRLLPAEQPLHSVSASNLGVVYVAYESGGLRAVNYAGHPLWSVSFADDFVHGPILDSEGRIYLVTEAYELLQLSPDGRTEISYALDRLPEHVAMRPGDTLVFAYEDGSIDVVDPAVGEETRIVEPGSAVRDLFVDEDGTVSVLFFNGALGRIPSHERSLPSEAETDGSSQGYSIRIVAQEVSRAASTGNGEYITTDRNGLVRRVDRNGEVLMTIRPGLVEGSVRELSAPVIGRSGHVAFTDMRWALWSFSGVEVSESSWRGEGAGGLRDGRITELEPPSRRELRDITQFRILSSLATRSTSGERERILQGIENDLDSGDLLGCSSWISYVLIDIAGELAGSADSGGRNVSSEIASRAYIALGRVGDTVAARALQYAAENVGDVSQLESIMTAIAQSGYEHDDPRDVIIRRAFRRGGGAGEHAGLDIAYIRSIETVWEQGGRLSPSTVSQVAELQEAGANRVARNHAKRLLRRMLFGSPSSMFSVSLLALPE